MKNQKILEQVCESHNLKGTWLSDPWTFQGYVGASDGKRLILFPATVAKDQELVRLPVEHEKTIESYLDRATRPVGVGNVVKLSVLRRLEKELKRARIDRVKLFRVKSLRVKRDKDTRWREVYEDILTAIEKEKNKPLLWQSPFDGYGYDLQLLLPLLQGLRGEVRFEYPLDGGEPVSFQSAIDGRIGVVMPSFA